jgi:hypothetical protein
MIYNVESFKFAFHQKYKKGDTKKIYKNPTEMYSYRKRNSPLS